MKILKHLLDNPFVFATGLAALIHSTWSAATFFGGQQPEGWQVVGWLTPALLIAFALDIGQIVTSHDIRVHGLTWQRGVTFVVFAIATYYLQWLYTSHHMPALALAAGVRSEWSSFAGVMSDAAMWVIPALLPLSTLLYTFSGQRAPVIGTPAINTEASITAMPAPGVPLIRVAELPRLELPTEAQLPLPEPAPAALHEAVCPACGWTKDGYGSADLAARALRVHRSQHCAASSQLVANGNGARHE